MDQPTQAFPEPLFAAYIGATSRQRYLRVFRRFHGRGIWWPLGFNLPALLWPLTWAVYRRLTGLAIMVGLLRLVTVIVLLLADLLANISDHRQLGALAIGNAMVNVFIAVVADRALYARGSRTLQSLARAGMPEDQIAEKLRGIGGTRHRATAIFTGGWLTIALAAAVIAHKIHSDYQAQAAYSAGYVLIDEMIAPRLADFIERTGRCPSASEFGTLFDAKNMPRPIDAVLVPWDSDRRLPQDGCEVIEHYSSRGAASPRIAGTFLQVSIFRQKNGAYHRSCSGTARQDDLDFTDMIYCQHVEHIEPFKTFGAVPAAAEARPW